MSEEELKKLKEFVFRDIRIIENTEKIYKIKTKEAINLFEQYKDKVKIYRCVMREIYATDPDAERWEIAFDSYLNNYRFLGDKNGYKKDSDNYLWYYKKTKITADVLTGPKDFIRIAEKLINGQKAAKEKKEELKSSLEMFCSVAYTVGNCCPVMKNPNADGDFCWSKLASFLNPAKLDKLDGLLVAEWENDIRKRNATNMFAVFPDNLSEREIIDKLMLTDYFDKNYNLIKKPTLKECEKMEADDLITLLKDVTKLIIKRGIRIYYRNRIGKERFETYAKALIEERKKELGIQ